MKNYETMIRDYRERLENYQTLIDHQKSQVRENRKNKASEVDKCIDLAELRKLRSLRDLCNQVPKDLEYLDE